jgi:hypothetical protein
MKRCVLLYNSEADPAWIRFGADRSNACASGITPP